MFEKLQESLATFGMDSAEKTAYTKAAKYGNTDKNVKPTGIDLTGAEVYTGYNEILKALNINLDNIFGKRVKLKVFIVRHNLVVNCETVKKSPRTMLSFFVNENDYSIYAVADSKFLTIGKKYQAALLVYQLIERYGINLYMIADKKPRSIKIDADTSADVYDLAAEAYITTAALFGTFTTKRALSIERELLYKTSRTAIKDTKEAIKTETVNAEQNNNNNTQQQPGNGPDPTPDPAAQPA